MADRDNFYKFLKKVAIGPAIEVGFHPWVEGLENIPESGAAILASNHLSFSDSIFLPVAVPRKITFMAKSEYFEGPGIRGKVVAAFVRGAGQVPVDRTGGNASMAAISTGVRLLNEGHLLGIYPEGTRSPDGRLYKGRTGIARLAIESGAPIIPVAMFNTEKIQPTGTVVPKVMRVKMIFGEPMYFDGDSTDLQYLRDVTDKIMSTIQEMSGQEYVDAHATKAKKATEESED